MCRNDDAAAGTGGGGATGSAGAGGTGGGEPPDGAPDAPIDPGLIIQEDQPGFAAVDGKVYPRQGSTSVTGYTGTGFADGDPGVAIVDPVSEVPTTVPAAAGVGKL